MLSLRGITKTYGNNTVVAPLDWKLTTGKTHVIIGPSGCGKSTLLRMMIGLVPPTGGEVHFNGALVKPGDWLNVRRRMGYVLQDGGLFPHMTARDNVLLMARELHWPREQQKERLSALADLTHFPREALKRYPAQLSGGQKQRVGIMRALLLDPDVILLDEPLGALDPLIRFNLQSDLKDIFQNLSKTVVIVTHDVGEAQYFGDDIMLMRRGKVVQHGTFSEFVTAPRESFVTEFLSAQRTFLGEDLEAIH